MNTTPLKVLHINNTDLTGRRFNGFDLIEDLKPYNIECKQLVLRKESQNPNVGEILDTKTKRSLQNRLIEFETNHAYSKIVFPWADDIASHPFFLEADVVHYHLIHNNMLSTLDFARLTQLKPSVWTWHDPWPLTGHCIHPEDCTNWHKRCSPCPFLERPFSLKVDRSSAHWKIKLQLANEASVTPVVASQYMRDLCLNSEIGKAYTDPVVVPFGIKYDDLPSPDLQKKTRGKLGIPHDHFVIFFRCETDRKSVV